jgi:uncharacterized protein (TIGR00255 family)
MKSMTGYGSSNSQTTLVELEVTVKSVNGRFLESRFHIPRDYHSLEGQLKKILADHLRRGTVDVSIYRRLGEAASHGEVRIQLDLAQKWVRSYQELGRSLGLHPELRLEQIAERPEILKIEERAELSSKEGQQLIKTFTAAVQACDQEREREGKALAKDLGRYVAKLQKLVAAMMELRAKANDELSARMKARLTKLDVPVDSQRLAQEVAVYLDRADIAEELARLAEHLLVFEKLLKSSDSVGKKLDFYTQELLREVNTIGSKAQLAKLTEMVVEAKALIERIREQVQNIE